jgi:hypothetical protein
VQEVSLLNSAQTESEAHSASYPMCSGALSQAIKRQGREADHSLSSSAEVKKSGAITPLPHVFMT